jgi:uncharacterized membrane protein YjgN (DUF898 family)
MHLAGDDRGTQTAMAMVESADMVKRGEFRGNASEYFGIWIVNILLTIVTLGIYSAWAKVRRKRYFYGNTFVDNHSFDYHATGKQIFIGRIIVFVVIAIVNVISAVSPIAAIIAPLIFLLALPFFIVRSLRFNARVTSYRNVHFDFTGKSLGAFTAIILGSLLATFSLGILAPLSSRWANRYVFNSLHYGDRPFSTDPRLGALYRGWLTPAVMVVIGLAIAGTVGWFIAWPAFREFAQSVDNGTEQSQVLIGIALIYGTAGFIYGVAVRNVVLNATLLDGKHPLVSDLSRLRMLWISVSNTVVTLLTLGLMRPWAAVREQAYLVSHTGIAPQGDMGTIMASIQTTGSAFSSEYMDLEGMDFGF